MMKLQRICSACSTLGGSRIKTPIKIARWFSGDEKRDATTPEGKLKNIRIIESISRDPFLNRAIERYLFQSITNPSIRPASRRKETISPEDEEKHILFISRNSPTIVVRNQEISDKTYKFAHDNHMAVINITTSKHDPTITSEGQHFEEEYQDLGSLNFSMISSPLKYFNHALNRDLVATIADNFLLGMISWRNGVLCIEDSKAVGVMRSSVTDDEVAVDSGSLFIETNLEKYEKLLKKDPSQDHGLELVTFKKLNSLVNHSVISTALIREFLTLHSVVMTNMSIENIDDSILTNTPYVKAIYDELKSGGHKPGFDNEF